MLFQIQIDSGVGCYHEDGEQVVVESNAGVDVVGDQLGVLCYSRIGAVSKSEVVSSARPPAHKTAGIAPAPCHLVNPNPVF